MSNENPIQPQEDIVKVYDILNLVMALVAAYRDIRRSLKSDRPVSRRVRQMRSNLLAVLAADRHAKYLGDAFEAGTTPPRSGIQLDLPFKRGDLP